MDALLEGLNDAQKSAVTSPANVVQVLAPPGSGKTKTLTARVAYHINHERLQPWNIIVCTFTIKAAREMKERIKGFVGEKLESKLILGTFHSVARRFLSRYGQEIGIDKNFGIADTSDSTAILKRIVKRYEYTVEPGHARSRISKLKAKGTSAEDFAKTSKNVNDNEFAMVYASYEEHLKSSNLLDYDDLLLRCVDLLRKSPSCVSTIQAVLIDEYQDTNNIQYELMRLLAQQTKRITIVGDPDQSIYSFRSAEIKNLLRMRTDYPESVVINLENNYRSSGCILTSAMAVIEQDESRPQKALIATHGVGEPPTLRHLVSANTEARWIVEEIQRTKTLTAGLLGYNDFAILLRSSPLSLQIERALGQAGIPYRMVAGTKFFDRAEIRIILDYLRVISQPEHNDAVARVINVPSRKVGESTVKALLEEAEMRKVTLWKLVLDHSQGRKRAQYKISLQAEKGMSQFVDVILSSRDKLLPEKGEICNLFDLIRHVINKIAFESYLKQTHKENWQDRWANVEELIAQATQMATAVANGEEISDDALPIVEGLEQRQDTAADILSKFLANVTLSSAADQEGADLDQVTVSTIHAAKGLEWPVVFIPAVYDGSIPHSRADDHDEERRLLYVGMTRAQGLLYLSCPFKQSGQEETTLSKFVSDRSIQKLFNERGPDLAFKRSTVPDLARILRRDCPEAADLARAQTLLERLEDDKYPATREEIDGEGLSWGTSYDDRYNNASDRTEPLNKRRKLESTTSYQRDGVSVTMHRSTSYTAPVTSMQAVNAGFTSARDLGDIQAMQQEAERIRMLASARDAESGRRAYDNFTHAEPKPQKAKSTKPRAAGQGAITSFFLKRSTSTISEDTDPAPLPCLQRSSSALEPLHDISNVPPRPAQPHPLSLPAHKLQTRPMTTKPKRNDPSHLSSNDPATTKYILLSSSPVRPDGEERKELVDPASPVKVPGTRPPASLHTTSMHAVQGQRRTLGTRRAVVGWSVKSAGVPLPRPRGAGN
ncbi:ATP-dependent DNA helicase srs2 [Coniothyrium glycines]